MLVSVWLALTIVLLVCLLLYEQPPQGCASKSALCFLLAFPPDLGRRQSTQRRRKKGSYLSWGKGFNPRSQSKETPSLSLSLSFSVPEGNAQWAAYLCCCVPTLYRSPLLSEATQHGAKGHAGMPIMHCGNCDCFWFKWFQMRLLEVHSEKQLVAVAIDMHKSSA